MLRFIRHTLIFSSVFLSLLTACDKSSHFDTAKKLVELDSMVNKYPRYVYTITGKLRTQYYPDYYLAYIQLLNTIATDNLGEEFHSDSIITFCVNTFAPEKSVFSNEYLRSLVYQGIVRYKMGIINNRAYQPMKLALDINKEQHKLDIRTQQSANYYLGLIHTKNNNISTAHDYFKEALICAEKMNDSTILFKTYREMYWNRMKALDFETARTLLESLQSFTSVTDEQIHDTKNAEALFYNSTKKYRNALKLDYELMQKDTKNNDIASLLADYYRISDNYKFLGKLDSALHYGELVTKNIVDTTYFLNYHYYLNVAEIASKMGDWKKSTDAYAQVYRLQNRAINQQLNTQILELERKYDVASAENRAISLKNRNKGLQITLILFLLGGIVGYLIVKQRNKIMQAREKSMRQEKRILEQEKLLAEEKTQKISLDKQLTERKLVEKQFVIPIYRQISQRNLDIKNFLLDLQSNAYINKNPQLLQKIEIEYRNFIQNTKITDDTQFLNEQLFADLTGITLDESVLFNESEKMMMAFIATGADNQQMATLLNTSVESVRVRKSKLKKKMMENGVKIPDGLTDEI